MSADADVIVVRYGSRVTIREANDEVRTVDVRDDGRPTFRTVASDSPLGRALMGAARGATVTVVMGRGVPDRVVTIETIERGSTA
jgi:transcription elongation GreA/GreB family factor